MTEQDIQLKYELESDAAAAVARLQELQQAAMSGDADAPRAQKLTAQMFDNVRTYIAQQMDVATRGTGGKYKGWVRRVGAEKAALIAMRECIAICGGNGKTRNSLPSAQLLTLRIGRLYETEVRIVEAEEVNPMYMQKIHDQVRRNGTVNYGHLRRLYNVAYDRVMKGELDSEMTDAECIQVGKFGLDACYEAGLIRLASEKGMAIYELDPDCADYLTDYAASDVHNVVDRGAGAMTCPPLPWTCLDGGGYLSLRRQAAFPLMSLRRVRRSERRRLREQFTAEKMPQVFECANYLQSVPFAVHAPTMDAVRRVWQSGGATMGLPAREKPAKPILPLPPEWVKADATEAELAVFTAWKRVMTQYYTDMKKWRGHTQEIAGFLKMAQRDTSRLYFPVMMDTRGRWYYNGTPNPQGTDVAKAALHFAERKPLGMYGVNALKVQIANSYGFDKGRTTARIRWVDEHWAEIERALDEPENHADVWGDDSPWCMFAAAWELREAYRSGNPATYLCGLPVHQDATCSGLQHFSAMLRDPVGGRYVNLFDAGGDAKQDIYRKVADGAVEALVSREAGVARDFWLQAGISRSQAKKPVMTYVYGATLRGTAEFLEEEALHSREDVKLEGQRNCDIATYGAKMLFNGIEQAVPAAAQAMRWLREVCRTVPKGQRMEWTTPTGFKVQHDYQEVEEVRVRINSCGVNRVMIYEPLDETNPSKMQNAIAPNFVHALDASHLTLTANRMKAEGLTMVAIHDSFGTHPCDVVRMNEILREEFVNLYEKHDVLLDFLWEVGGVGELPKRGTLDLQQVKESEFFFC